MIRRSAAVLVAALCLTGCVSPENPPTVAPTTRTAQADAIRAIVTNVMASEHLESALVRVTIDGKEVISEAFGESMTGVPATTDMHFRNGAVAISYVSTLLLILAEENRVGLDDLLSDYLPDIAHADRVTLRQLAQMTSGYHDYVLGNDAFGDELYENPFRQWKPEELLQFAVTKPLQYEPGTNWSYAHTNYVLLGLALERATGEPMPKLLSEKVLDPLGLRNTANSFTPAIPEPALHAFTAERRAALDIPATVPFLEDSTYWNPSWTITHGAIQTTTIEDLATSSAGIGSGELLSADSYRIFASKDLRGRTHSAPGCPTCAPQTEHYTYGLGIVLSGDWLLQNPMFFGYAAVGAYLPQRRISIATAATFNEQAFDPEGNYSNAADTLFRKIGAAVAPEHAPPTQPTR